VGLTVGNAEYVEDAKRADLIIVELKVLLGVNL
jgi:hypothetical protein